MTTKTKYDTQASEFLAKFELTLEVRQAAFDTCPQWDETDCKHGKHSHGHKYNVRFGRSGRPFLGQKPTLDFDFWGSQNDAEKHKRPSQYDVLACVGSDVNMPTTADEVVAEFGDMKPSQAQATADHARKLRAFFTDNEREALAEIQ